MLPERSPARRGTLSGQGSGTRRLRAAPPVGGASGERTGARAAKAGNRGGVVGRGRARSSHVRLTCRRPPHPAPAGRLPANRRRRCPPRPRRAVTCASPGKRPLRAGARRRREAVAGGARGGRGSARPEVTLRRGEGGRAPAPARRLRGAGCAPAAALLGPVRRQRHRRPSGRGKALTGARPRGRAARRRGAALRGPAGAPCGPGAPAGKAGVGLVADGGYHRVTLPRLLPGVGGGRS